MVTIGGTTARRHAPGTRGKVPETLFYDTPQNLAVMEAMLQDFLLGEHLLLVGNQAKMLLDREYCCCQIFFVG
jgi:5-methylthioribose kinase